MAKNSLISDAPSRRTPPPKSKNYSNLQTTLKFDVTGSMSCSMNCADAYKFISQGPCGRIGSQQNVMTKEASIDRLWHIALRNQKQE